MSETTESLAFSAVAIGEHFGDQYPNDGTLANTVCSDIDKDADRNDAEVLSKEAQAMSPSERMYPYEPM